MLYQVFLVAFVVSYLGSVPPGTINITAMQLSILKHKRGAFFFALAASLTEFVYAGITVRFQLFLSERPQVMENLPFITAIAMLILGVVNLRAHSSASSISKKNIIRGRSGFKLGVVLGLLNPLTVPFWLAVTAYLQSHNWIRLDGANFWYYLAGISIGTFALLLTVRSMGGRFTKIADNQFLVHKLPGIIFLLLGAYNLIVWFY